MALKQSEPKYRMEKDSDSDEFEDYGKKSRENRQGESGLDHPHQF